MTAKEMLESMPENMVNCVKILTDLLIDDNVFDSKAYKHFVEVQYHPTALKWKRPPACDISWQFSGGYTNISINIKLSRVDTIPLLTEIGSSEWITLPAGYQWKEAESIVAVSLVKILLSDLENWMDGVSKRSSDSELPEALCVGCEAILDTYPDAAYGALAMPASVSSEGLMEWYRLRKALKGLRS